MSSLFAGKKIFLLGFIIVLLFAIPLTVYLSQRTQQTTTKASPATTLSITPSSTNINVGDTTKFDIMMNPGTNLVSFVKLTITYDATKFTIDPSNGFVQNTVFQQILQGPNYNSGSVTISMSVGSDPAAIINSTTKVGTLTLKAIANTNGSTTPIIIKDKPETQVLSIGSGDQANENVLLGQPTPATVTIGGGSSSGGTATTNTGLTCSSLVLDRATSGTAPYSVTFTASGKNTNGTIQKVSFSFGDGQLQDLTTSGGIGTNSVNAQMSHTYQNAGTYTASVVLTDNKNATTDPSACKTTITVAAKTSSSGSSGGGSGSGSVVVVAPTDIPVVELPTEVPTVTITPTPTLPPTGPGDMLIGIGVAGVMLSILGGLLLVF